MPLARRALAIREKALGKDYPDVAQSLNNLAELYHHKGDYAAAEPLYTRALAIREKALGKDHPDVAQSLNNLAELYRHKGNYATAEPLYNRALAIREKALGKDHPDVAQSLNNLALLYHHKGDYAAAEPLYNRALAIREKALGKDHPEVAQSLYNLASLYHHKGDYAAAEPLYIRALAIQEKALGKDDYDVATSLNNLAALYHAKGDYAAAEPLCTRALAIYEKALGKDHPDVATSLNNLAGLYQTKGDYAAAEPLLTRALAIREKALGKDHPDVAQSLNDLAWLYLHKGDYAAAESLHTRALAIREKALGKDHPLVATSLDNLAWIDFHKGDHAAAEPLYTRALAIREKALGKDNHDVATSLNNLAMVYQTKGDYAAAEPLYTRALAIQEKALGKDHPEVAACLCHISDLYMSLGLETKAITVRARAAAVEERNLAAVLVTGSDEQKRLAMNRLRWTTDTHVSLHLQFAPANASARTLALGTILRRKGRTLDAMASILQSARRRLTAEDKDKLDRLKTVSAQYSALMLRGPGALAAKEGQEFLAKLEEQRGALEGEISRTSPEFQAAFRPITIPQVQDRIPEGAALIEMFQYRPYRAKASLKDRWGAPRYAAYILGHRGDIAWADLGEAAPIEDAVHEFLPTLRRAAGASDAPARKLDALVMQPVRKLLGDTRTLFLSSDGLLNLVPFAALRDEQGRYLLERYSFTYLTSGRDLVRLATTRPPQMPPFILAAPDFNSDASSTLASAPAPTSADLPHSSGQRSTEMTDTSFRPLPFAFEEARALGQRIAKAKVLTGAQATESAIENLHGPQILHVSTHGFFLRDLPAPSTRELNQTLQAAGKLCLLPYAENPLLRSGLVFAGANRSSTGDDDGILTALEASQLDLDGTKLVVLSACETGVGDARNGDGVYGLRRALVMAGAETQVMSLWKVDDEATRELMVGYYDKLLHGGGRSEAMRQVQLAMLHSGSHANPYYWASFIVSGNPAALDGKPVTPLGPPPVTPSSHGCGCNVGASSPSGVSALIAALALLSLPYRRTRRPPLPSS